jgi:hypothetical protein
LRHELNGVVYPNILAMESTKDHAAIKRPIAGIYSMSNVTKSERFIDECILQFVHQLDQEFNDKGKTLPVYQWAHYCRGHKHQAQKSSALAIRMSLTLPAQTRTTQS